MGVYYKGQNNYPYYLGGGGALYCIAYVRNPLRNIVFWVVVYYNFDGEP